MKIKITLISFIALMLTNVNADAQVYDSLNISMYSRWYNPFESTATSYGIKYNGIWGWNDNLGNEYAILGSSSGTYFINVTNPSIPVLCDSVPGRRNNCIWREIKTYQNYCYMVSDDPAPNSFQIVDLSFLPDSVHVVYDSNVLFERCHTIYIDGDKLYGGTVRGGSIGNVSMAVFSLANPANPVLLRTVNQDFSIPGGSVHDMFVRNDTIYASCGTSGLYIFKLLANNHFSFLNSLVTYIDQGYNHSSALTDDGNYLVMTDEVPTGLDIKIVDVSNFANMTVVSNFHSDPNATAHNPFIKGNILYLAYYMDGLQVYDISNPFLPVRIGFFDTYYQNTPGNYPTPGYAGAWGDYPWLPSGNILVSDMQSGLFVLDVSGTVGINDLNNKSDFAIQPNPVAKGNELLVRFKKAMIGAKLNIFDVAGRVVFQTKVSGESINLNTSMFSSGIYSFCLITEGKVSTEKFVVIE